MRGRKHLEGLSARSADPLAGERDPGGSGCRDGGSPGKLHGARLEDIDQPAAWLLPAGRYIMLISLRIRR